MYYSPNPSFISQLAYEEETEGMEKREEVRGEACPTHQIGIGPVSLQGCGDFANNQIIHLLGGFWVVSGGSKDTKACYSFLVCISLHLNKPSREEMNV